ncbi:MAG: HAD hydrolase-like protein [Firmicutes bacterium]|nr:HAD hydrolase-like protein [Bacillota bacterium]
MKKYDTILFDLDGTLTDSGLGIANAVLYALDKYGIPQGDVDSSQFVGPPLRESFKRFYGFSDEKAEEAVTIAREYYTATGVFENTPYEGVYEMLDALKASGKRLLMATAKPDLYTDMVVDKFDLRKYFEYFGTATMDGSRVHKDVIIKMVLDDCDVTDVEHAIMIGDRGSDITGASAYGLDSIGVLYGYGTREELEKAGATYLAETTADVVKLLLGE